MSKSFVNYPKLSLSSGKVDATLAALMIVAAASVVGSTHSSVCIIRKVLITDSTQRPIPHPPKKYQRASCPTP